MTFGFAVLIYCTNSGFSIAENKTKTRRGGAIVFVTYFAKRFAHRLSTASSSSCMSNSYRTRRNGTRWRLQWQDANLFGQNVIGAQYQACSGLCKETVLRMRNGWDDGFASYMITNGRLNFIKRVFDNV